MATDNTQELDEIFDKMGYTKNTDFRKDAGRLIADWHNKQTINELDAIMEWHEKEVGAVLDRLQEEQRAWMHEHTDLKLGYATYLLSNIEAERAKLKEVNNGIRR